MDEFTDAQYLRVYVRQLRQKIEGDAEQPQYILTETRHWLPDARARLTIIEKMTPLAPEEQ